MVQEAPLRKVAAAGTVALAVALALAAGAGAGRECDGLDVCISVTGPWVVVPAASGQRTPTYWELRCPRRNQIVGGVDANVAHPSVAVEFLGILGGPVNPGITTASAVVFSGLYTGPGARATSYRPLIGCVPTSGGGRGTTSVTARSPVQPPLRRVRSVKLKAGTSTTLRHGCRRGERLVGSSAAIAFRRKDAPTAELVGGVRMAKRTTGGQVVVTLRVSSALPASARAEVQIHAVCSRPRR